MDKYACGSLLFMDNFNNHIRQFGYEEFCATEQLLFITIIDKVTLLVIKSWMQTILLTILKAIKQLHRSCVGYRFG